MRLLIFCLLVACGSCAEKAWQAFASDSENLRKLRCSVCLSCLEDTMAHLGALRHYNADRSSPDAMRGHLASFDNLCERAEDQFWAMAWTPEGPADMRFVKKYDIEMNDKEVGARLAAEGKVAEQSFFGTVGQKRWATNFFLKTCHRIMRDIGLEDHIRKDATLNYPEHCPLEECRDDTPLYPREL
ncbi:hypothetical protein DIPPA_09661 [Diplonema papillatum]|nr:hypothetical protein DIPPA_09661 [Diplonema papillatum]